MKKTAVILILALALCVCFTVTALAAEGKTVTDAKGNITVSNVLKETTFLFYDEECPVYWVPDTGAKVTFLNVEKALADEDGFILFHGWVVYNGEVTDEGTGWDINYQLRADGTYNVEFWLDEEEQQYPELYDNEHLTTIGYLDSRIYLGFVKSDVTPAPVAPISEPAALVATPTASTVLVNGQNVAFDAYNIGGNNYFKLRDLANVLNGTEKQFEVSFDSAANAIALTSGKAYTPVGGEMTGKGEGAKTPVATSSKILLDGVEISLTAYNIGGNNYFKLRDIGETFDFGVTWDSASSTIAIDTGVGYTAE